MRLIDADKLIEVLNKKSVPFNANVNDAILTAPTVDAVEVVRCKDCKWWELVDDYYAKGYGECTCPRSVIKRSTFLNEDWYCANGERRENVD